MPPKEKKLTIYALKCKDNKYYIGKTTKDILERMAEHLGGIGAEFTKIYYPTEIFEFFEGDDFDEDKLTLKYMLKYGIDNVRGGSYSQVKMSPRQTADIIRKLRGATNACFNCGSLQHFERDCKAKKEIICWECGETGHMANVCPHKKPKEIICYRCHQKGHISSQCGIGKNNKCVIL